MKVRERDKNKISLSCKQIFLLSLLFFVKSDLEERF